MHFRGPSNKSDEAWGCMMGPPIFGNAPIAARTGGGRGEGGTWNVDGPRVLFHPIRYIEPQ